MGKNSNNKADRANMRLIAKELLAETLTAELTSAIEKALASQLHKRLDSIDKHMLETLSKIETDTKTVLSGILRAQTPLSK